MPVMSKNIFQSVELSLLTNPLNYNELTMQRY